MNIQSIQLFHSTISSERNLLNEINMNKICVEHGKYAIWKRVGGKKYGKSGKSKSGTWQTASAV